MRERINKSFTLIELLVVIAIIGVLAALVIPNLTQTRAKARDARRIEDLRTLQNALELYYLDHNAYPSGPIGSNSQDGFCLEKTLDINGVCSSPDNFCGLIKPYLARLPKDPLFKSTDPSSPCYYYITDTTGQAYKAAAKMEKDTSRAENDGGTNSQWFEISDTGFKGLSLTSASPPFAPPATAAAISTAAIAGVTAPVKGATPVATITEATQYTGAVTWSPVATTFAGATV